MLVKSEENIHQVESENKKLKLENEFLLRKIEKTEEEGKTLVLSS